MTPDKTMAIMNSRLEEFGTIKRQDNKIVLNRRFFFATMDMLMQLMVDFERQWEGKVTETQFPPIIPYRETLESERHVRYLTHLFDIWDIDYDIDEDDNIMFYDDDPKDKKRGQFNRFLHICTIVLMHWETNEQTRSRNALYNIRCGNKPEATALPLV